MKSNSDKPRQPSQPTPKPTPSPRPTQPAPTPGKEIKKDSPLPQHRVDPIEPWKR